MFRADAETDDTSRDAPENGTLSKYTHRERRLERSGLDQHPRNDPALHGDLQPLRHARGQLAALLDPAQVIDARAVLRAAV